MTVRIGVPLETAPGEARVALAPGTLKRIASADALIAIETGAGAESGFHDREYEEAGAKIAAGADEALGGSDIVLKVAPPGEAEVDMLREGAVLACLLRPHENAALIERLAERQVTALALELVPRITRAQAMDALSSQSNLAGYKAVLIAAATLGQIFPLLMTAAGTLSPARVLVLGAGVAGLQAIATAKRLGADSWGYDIRSAAAEQVESLGGKFVRLEETPLDDDAETAGGYAKALGKDEQARQRELLAQHIARADVVITTALVPGRPAPVLVTEDTVERMRPGSVIVDLAGEAGGNCSLSAPGQTVVERGVTIHAPLNLPATLPRHASQLLGNNLSALVKPMIGEDGVVVNLEDDVTGPCCVTHAGEVRFAV